LSSAIETGIEINPSQLTRIQIENWPSQKTRTETTIQITEHRVD